MTPIRILLADSNLAFVEALRRFLQCSAVVVGVTSTGCEAVQAASRLRPDLVLIDIALLEMTGLEATRLIKAQVDPPRVIILTLLDQSEYVAEVVRAGADGLAAKYRLDVDLMPVIWALFPAQFTLHGRTAAERNDGPALAR